MHEELREPWTFDHVMRWALTLATIGGLIWLLQTLADVLLPFFIAAALAYLLNPLVTRIERRLGSRTGAVLLTAVGLVIVSLSIIALMVPLVGKELVRFNGIVSQLQDQSSTAVRRMREVAAADPEGRLAWALERTRQYLVSEDFRALVGQGLQRLAPTALGVVAGAVRGILALIGLSLILVYLVFLLIDYRHFSRRWKGYLPPDWREPILEFVDEFQLAMRRYFRGQSLVATATGILYAIGFYFIGLPLGIVLGLFIGVLSMVPYLALLAALPAVMLALVGAVESGAAIWLALLKVAAVFAVVQVLQDTLLTPKLMGPAVGLRPIVIMLSVFIWGRLLGFVGLIMAIPLTCLGLAYYRRFILKKVAPAEPAASSSAPGI